MVTKQTKGWHTA